MSLPPRLLLLISLQKIKLDHINNHMFSLTIGALRVESMKDLTNSWTSAVSWFMLYPKVPLSRIPDNFLPRIQEKEKSDEMDKLLWCRNTALLRVSASLHCCHSGTGAGDPKPRLSTGIPILGHPVRQLGWRIHGCVEDIEGVYCIRKNRDLG